tara:strand:- start:45 stop:398 length:354 start_codon:yes stop_codon:yes gene_type:complete
MDTLWVIAKKMRLKKEQGEFKTYRDAYRWAAINIPSSKVQSLTFQKLENAYHKAKSEGKVGIKKISIPIMITNQMRMELLTLGWSRDEIKYLTPKECWEIIGRGVPKKPSRDRARNQ